MPDPISWSYALPWLLGALAGGYALGSIPFGLIFVRLGGSGDVRDIGSGNIGATNALRAGGGMIGLATLLADCAKGLAAVVLAGSYGIDMAVSAGAGAFLGHVFPIWLGFRGGKGSAVMLGVLLGLYWPLGLVYALVFLAAAGLTRYSSLASISAGLTSPLAAILFREWQIAELAGVLAVVMILAHRSNFARLRAGCEPKIGKTS